MSVVTVNPVLARELKERMRGRRAAVILTIYLSSLSLILWLAYQGASSNQGGFGAPLVTEVASVGRGVFEWLLFVMMLIIMFLVPAQTAGAIAGERERQTLVPLQITLLKPRSILLGKIGAAMAFLVLLAVAAVPLLSVAYLIGGVTIGEVLGATALAVVTGVCLGAMCAAVSTFSRRVQSATVLSYGLTLALVVGTFIAYGAAAVVDSSRGNDEADPPSVILLLNPLATVGDLVGGEDSGTGSSPFDGIKQLTDPNENEFFDRIAIGDDLGGVGFGFDAPVVQASGDAGVPFWAWSLGSLVLLAVTSVGMASRRLRTPAESER